MGGNSSTSRSNSQRYSQSPHQNSTPQHSTTASALQQKNQSKKYSLIADNYRSTDEVNTFFKRFFRVSFLFFLVSLFECPVTIIIIIGYGCAFTSRFGVIESDCWYRCHKEQRVDR